MRWLDVAVLGGLAAAGFLFLRQARLTGAQFLVRVFRIAMLLSAALAACLAIAVLRTFALVPYVPASYPPATPGTWISLALNYAAPGVASLATASLLVSSFYFLSTRSRAA